MDEKEMKVFLDKTGLPVAYSHFPDNQKPPFLCFLTAFGYFIICLFSAVCTLS